MRAARFTKDVLSVPRSATEVILHTRFTTQGSETNNLNNHPVRVGPVVGVHNGMISNDDQLFRLMGVQDKRQGQVDTEAIFASIFYGPQLGETGAFRRLPGCEGPADALSEVRGSAAVAWLDERDEAGVLHLARTRTSPLAWAQTAGGSLIFASTADVVGEACEIFQLKIESEGYLREGQYCTIQHGSALSVQEFKPAPEYFYSGSRGTVVLGGNYKRGSSYYGWDNFDGDKNDDEYAVTIVTPPRDSELVKMLDASNDVVRRTSTSSSEREAAIDGWIDGLKAEDDQACLSLAVELKAFARVGDYVSTTLTGEDAYGQIVEMPESFPHGWYLVRLLVPSVDCSDYEAVLVRRKQFEFEMVASKPTPLALPKGGEYVACGVTEFQKVNAAVLSESTAELTLVESEGGHAD